MLNKNERFLFYFNNMVNWDARLSKEIPFLVERFKSVDADKILDVACGIGRHIMALSLHGFDAHGADLEPLHIKQAQEQALKEAPRAKFFIDDMTTLENVGNNSFEGLMTVGNTLTSLGKEGVKKSFSAFYRILKPGGIFIGHILNYNSFKKEDRSDVRCKVINGVEYMNIKTFHFEEDYVLIVTNLLEKEGEKWVPLVVASKMFPLEKEFIEETLKHNGFKNIKFFGSLKGEPFDYTKSKDMVFAAEK